MNPSIIFNPFSKFGEWPLLITGIAATLAGSFIGGYLNMTFDGFMDVHPAESDFLQSITENVINIISVAAILFFLGLIINRKTRFIDLVNTAIIARIPTYLAALISANPILDNFAKRVMENPADLTNIYGDTTELTIVLVISCVVMFMFAWSIILLVNGFRTATNIKKILHWILFVFALILAEILSKYIIYNI